MLQPPHHHLAQFNIARVRYPLDDPRMREFVDNVERVNGLADKFPDSYGDCRMTVVTP